MARRGSGEGALVIFGIAIVVIAAIPKEIWISLGIIGLIVLAVYLYAKFKSGAGAKHTATNEPILAQLTSVRPAPRANVFSKPATVIPEPLVIRPSPTSSTPQIAASEESFFVAQGTPAAVSNEEVGFRIPPPSLSVTRKGTWVRPGTSITVGGVTLRDGMVYVGTSLPTSHGGNDPCLIHPHKPVANAGDFTQRQIGYWGNYSEITPSARRAYLNWLAQGRSHPDADIGYVFLFFYGLERRVLIGEKDDPSAPQDRPAITDEIHRLLGIYGAKSGSFQSYANALLDRVTLASLTTKLYERPVPELSKSFELPIYLRVALGQAAMDRAPISSGLALAWVRLNPNSALRTPAVRCADEFDRLFVERYTELFRVSGFDCGFGCSASSVALASKSGF